MTTRERGTKKSGDKARSPRYPAGDTADAASERRQRIAEAAYYNAERRGFSGNLEVEDWLEAEKQIDSTAAGREAQQPERADSTAPGGTAENGASPARKERRRAAPRGTRRATADRTAR